MEVKLANVDLNLYISSGKHGRFWGKCWDILVYGKRLRILNNVDTTSTLLETLFCALLWKICSQTHLASKVLDRDSCSEKYFFFAVIARKFLSKYVSAVLQEILKFGYKIKLLSWIIAILPLPNRHTRTCTHVRACIHKHTLTIMLSF